MIDTFARLLNAIPSPHYKWVMYYLPDEVGGSGLTLCNSLSTNNCSSQSNMQRTVIIWNSSRSSFQIFGHYVDHADGKALLYQAKDQYPVMTERLHSALCNT